MRCRVFSLKKKYPNVSAEINYAQKVIIATVTSSPAHRSTAATPSPSYPTAQRTRRRSKTATSRCPLSWRRTGGSLILLSSINLASLRSVPRDFESNSAPHYSPSTAVRVDRSSLLLLGSETMATPAVAARRPRPRRPFAAVASLSAARRRVMPATTPGSENVEPLSDGATFEQCLRRFRKFSGEAAATKPAFPISTKAAVLRNKRCSATPASRKPSAPRTASRKRPDSSASRRKASAAAAAAYEAPRAPLCDFSEDLCEKKVRARLSSPSCDVAAAEEQGQATRKRAAWGVTLEEAMADLPEPGEGRVRYLVDTFERLLSLSRVDHDAQSRGGTGTWRMMKKAASASSSPRKLEELDMASYPSVASSSSEISYCVADLPRRNRSSSSTRDERQLRRCNSIGSSERSWSRKVTRQHPFNLWTEQRGKMKEGSFVERMRRRMLEEERLRNPLAQGLPWTTDEPENLAKPPTKEPTEPFDVVLHSAVRAVGRARFDHQIAERNVFLEKLELEKERQQKMDEEIEIKHLRKEQVPRAHPMPDFSKPFVPKRSVKPHTVPREPRFHTRPTRHSPRTRS